MQPTKYKYNPLIPETQIGEDQDPTNNLVPSHLETALYIENGNPLTPRVPQFESELTRMYREEALGFLRAAYPPPKILVDFMNSYRLKAKY